MSANEQAITIAGVDLLASTSIPTITNVDGDTLLANQLQETLQLHNDDDGAGDSDAKTKQEVDKDTSYRPGATCASTPATTSSNEKNDDEHFQILCDLGYGIPKEPRPRREKILAISKQLVNFLTWQQHQVQQQSSVTRASPIEIVSCPDPVIQKALLDRMQELWKTAAAATASPNQLLTTTALADFPSHIISFSRHGLEEWVQEYYQKRRKHDDSSPSSSSSSSSPSIVYLSPDAEESLDPTQPPPRIVVIGLLIDRRTIQTNKSKDRAHQLHIQAARWPLDRIVANISPSEPLNVDCVLEGMQQWEWNCHNKIVNDDNNDVVSNDKNRVKACADAIVQALEHHTRRHPERPIHKKDQVVL